MQRLLTFKAEAEQRLSELNRQYDDLGKQRDSILTESVRIQGDIRTYEKLIALEPKGETGEQDAPDTTE